MGYFEDINIGPHNTLKNFIVIISKFYNVILIGFKKNNSFKVSSFWDIKNTKIIALNNYLKGHYYFNNSVFTKALEYLKTSDYFFFNGIWYPYLPILSLVFLLFKKKYVICPHGGLNKEENIKFVKFFYYKFFIRFCIKNCHFLQLLSPLELKLINENKFLKLKNFKYVILPNTVRLEKIYLNNNFKYKNYALSIGRLHPIKDLEFLINSWETLNKMNKGKNFLLIIAGTGSKEYTNKLFNLIERKQIKNIKFIGEIGMEEKIEMISHAKFTTNTSHTEALPTSILESLALSTPVLSTIKLGFQKYFIKESIIHTNKNYDDFAMKSESILKMKKTDYDNLKKKTLISFENLFSNKKITSLVKEFYDIN